VASSRPTHGDLSLHVEGDTRAVDQMLADFSRALQPDDLARWMTDDVYHLMVLRTSNRFDSEGDDVSGPWASLTPYTQAQRRRGGFGAAHPINVRTGAMKDHLLHRVPDVMPNTLGATMWFPARGGSAKNLRKVRIAQDGDPKSRTPARPVLGVNPNDLELVLKSAADHLARYQRGYGGGRLF
jgi:hypothetical protein